VAVVSLNLVLYGFINTALALLVSPLFISLIKKVKAYAQGRVGPPLLQTYYQLYKLFKKERVYSYQTSFIIRLTPYLSLVFMLVASLSVPLVFIPAADPGLGNIILFLYLMVMSRFFMALSGLDAGSSFGGMGSSREMTISAIIEPVVIIVFGALAYVLQTTSLFDMFAQVRESSFLSNPSLILTGISLFIILIVETSRIPVDNPETHLELTMIHEAMTLEYSGPDLALIELSHALKQTLLMGVLLNIIAPWGLAAESTAGGIALAFLAFVIKGSLLAVGVGIFESLMAKFRLFRVPGLFMLAFFFSFITVIFKFLA